MNENYCLEQMQEDPTATTLAQCPFCGASNDRSNNYCSRCGKSLVYDTEVLLAGLKADPVRAEIERQLRAVLATFTTQEFVVRDASTQVVERVIDFLKKLFLPASIIVSIILTLIVGVLSIFGIKTVWDANQTIMEAKTSAKAAQTNAEAAQTNAEAAQTNAEAAKANAEKAKERAFDSAKSADKYNKDIGHLTQQAAHAGAEIQNAEARIQRMVAAIRSVDHHVQAVGQLAEGAIKERVEKREGDLLALEQKVKESQEQVNINLKIAADDLPNPSQPRRPAPPPLQPRNSTVLWLDTDDLAVNQNGRKALSSLSVGFLTTQSTEQAEQLLVAHPEVGLVISNFHGPTIHADPGYEFLDYVKTHRPEIPYIFYTREAWFRGKQVLKHGAIGATHDPSKLKALVSNAIASESARASGRASIFDNGNTLVGTQPAASE